MSGPPHDAEVTAHELNNLLDGTMKSIELALMHLRHDRLSESQAAACRRLELADEVLARAADLVRRWSADASGMEGLLSPATPPRFGGACDASGTLEVACRHALSAVPPELEEAGIDLVARVDPEVAELPAGAVFNLLHNAVRNAAESILRRRHLAGTPDGDAGGDALSVEVASSDDTVRLEVRDTGAGFDDGELGTDGLPPRGLTHKKGAGHGIGLRRCRRIVHELGGTLWLEPLDPRGAAFRCVIPREALVEAAGLERAA